MIKENTGLMLLIFTY